MQAITRMPPTCRQGAESHESTPTYWAFLSHPAPYPSSRPQELQLRMEEERRAARAEADARCEAAAAEGGSSTAAVGAQVLGHGHS